MAKSRVEPQYTAFPISIPAGPKSTEFDDSVDAKARQITGIHSINVWVDGVVAGLQVTYTLATGKTYRAPVRGSKTGTKTRIPLEPDEELIQLSAEGNTESIRSLTFLSSMVDGTVRLHGPFGEGEVPVKSKGKPVKYKMFELLVGGSDDRGFSWYGGKVMALTGSTRAGRLTGLGVRAAPIVEVPAGFSSTATIAEDYREVRSGSKGKKKLQRYSVYRSTLVVPEGSGKVTLWAEEQVEVKVNGRNKTLDPVKGVELEPNALSQLTITVEAKALSVPAIKVRTEQMSEPWQWYTLHPDVAAHEKIASWDAGTLHANRKKLGISKKVSKEDCDAVQVAVANVARLGLPSVGQSSHERSIDADAMADSNWILDFSGSSIDYQKATKTTTAEAKQDADNVTRVAAASSLIKKIKRGTRKAGKAVKKTTSKATNGVAKVIVETSKTKPIKGATKGVKKIAKSAEHLGKNVAKTGQKLGKDIARGDVVSFGKHLGKGGLQLGKDVTRLGKHTVVTLIDVTGEAVEFVLDQAAALGELMLDLLESIGAKLIKIIEFLVDLLPWKAIARTQKSLLNLLEGALEDFASGEATAKFEGAIDEGLKWLEAKGEAALDQATRKLGGKVLPRESVTNFMTTAGRKAGRVGKTLGDASSKVMKLIEKALEPVTWLLGKLFDKVPLIGDILKILDKAAKQIAQLARDIGDVAKQAGEAIPEGLGAAISNLMAIADKPRDAPALLVSAMLQLVKAVIASGVLAIRGLVKLVFGAGQILAGVFLEIGRLDLFPGKKKRGDSIFVKIYNAVVGIDLSFFSVLTWLLAIPVTLVHMAIHGGKAPTFALAKRNEGVETARAVTAALCNFGEVVIVAFLNGAELARGKEGEKSNKEKLGEVGSLVLALISYACGLPLPKPEEEAPLEYAAFGVGSLGLLLDIIALVASKSSRAVRWDAFEVKGIRAGALLVLCIEGSNLGLQSAIIHKTKPKAAKYVAEISGGVAGVVDALVLALVPEPAPRLAVGLAAMDAVLGMTSAVAGAIDDL